MAGLGLLALIESGCRSNAAETVETVLSTGLTEPYGVAVDPDNNFYITDTALGQVVKLNPATGKITRFEGFQCPQGIIREAGTNRFLVVDAGTRRLDRLTFGGLISPVEIVDALGNPVELDAPAGLATDGTNVFIADQQSSRLLRVDPAGVAVVVSSNFLHPGGLAIDSDGGLCVADAGNNCIRRVANRLGAGVNSKVKVVAGTSGPSAFGYLDATNGLDALFDRPTSLLWTGSRLGLLVGDAGNHVVRKVDVTSTNCSVTTHLPELGPVFGDPTGMALDAEGGLLVVDRAGARLLRVHTAQPPQPAVTDPVIGYVVLTNIDLYAGTRLFAITNATFNNDVVVGVLAEPGTQTFFTIGPTDTPDGVPDPTPNNSGPPPYQDGMLELPPSLVDPVQPDLTIKAISTQPGRKPSGMVQARIRFAVANPVIYGDNPTSFTVDCATESAELWYTVGAGSDPVPNGTNAVRYLPGTSLNVFTGETSVSFAVRAFKTGYLQSAVIRRLFSVTNMPVSSLGFRRDFNGSVGATVLLPMEVSLGANEALESLQFRVEVTPEGQAPPIAGLWMVSSRFNDFLPMAQSGRPSYVSSFGLGSTRGLAVAYIGTNSLGRLADSGVVAVLAATLPAGSQASVGQSYTLALRQISGTLDGVQTPVTLRPMVDRRLWVTNIGYLVGDTAIARWYNLGDFGDGDLNNNDVNNSFYASLSLRLPPSYTDVFDAMDSFPDDTIGQPGGDGQIRFLDWQRTLERSLGLRKRVWRIRDAEGGRTSLFEKPAGWPLKPHESFSADGASITPLWDSQVRISAGTVEHAQRGSLVRVPVWVTVRPDANLAGMQLWPVISSTREALESEVASTFEVNKDAPSLPAPSSNRLPGFSDNTVVYVWNQNSLALRGGSLLGWLSFQIPAYQAPQAYHVRFANADGASAEEIMYDFETIPGRIWVGSGALEPAQQVPDEWRTKFFGASSVAGAEDTADPDGDGLSNRAEYLVNSNPVVQDWRIEVGYEGGHPTVSWFGEKGKRYQVLFSTDLKNWEALGDEAPGMDRIDKLQDVRTADKPCFYRVKALP